MPRFYVVLLMSGLAMGMAGQRVLADEAPAAPVKPAAPAADGGKTKAAGPSKPKAAHAAATDASGAHAAATAPTKPTKRKKAKGDSAKLAADVAPATVATPVVAKEPVASAVATPPTKPTVAKPQPAAPSTTCSLEEREQPRGGRLDVIGSGFGQAPVVRIAQRPARMIERRTDRISVQVPPDSDGGLVTLQTEGRSSDCGTLVIIGKNR